MIKQTLISLAVVAALGSTAPVNAHECSTDMHEVVADSAQKKQNAAKQVKAAATPASKSRVEETKKAVAEAHKAAAQRRLEQKQKHKAKAAVEDEDEDDEMVAYSDTASTVDGEDAANGGSSYSDDDDVDETNRYAPDRFKDPFSWFSFMATTGFGGILIALFCILMVFLFLIMPFIVLFMILRYIIRRHNDRVRLAEMAIKQGHPLTEEQMACEQQPRQYLWRKGVKNLSLGIGLMLLFLFMDAEALAGIGALIACMGAGKMFMARYDYNKKHKGDDFDDTFMSHDNATEPASADEEKVDDAESVKE